MITDPEPEFTDEERRWELAVLGLFIVVTALAAAFMLAQAIIVEIRPGTDWSAAVWSAGGTVAAFCTGRCVRSFRRTRALPTLRPPNPYPTRGETAP